MMQLAWYDWVGFIGVALVLLAYFLLQAQRLHGNGLVYQSLNLLGSSCILLSLLLGAFNWPAFLLELAWLLISLYGMASNRRRQRAGPS